MTELPAGMRSAGGTHVDEDAHCVIGIVLPCGNKDDVCDGVGELLGESEMDGVWLTVLKPVRDGDAVGVHDGVFVGVRVGD